MSIFINSRGERVNIDAPIEFGGIRYQNLRDPHVRNIVGVFEVEEPEAPVDYEEKFWYKTEQQTAPYVVYTKKSDEQILEIKRSELKNKIDSLEREQMLPRVLREFTLGAAELQAAAAGVDPMDNFAYRKLKEFDNTIRDLRTQLDSLGV